MCTIYFICSQNRIFGPKFEFLGLENIFCSKVKVFSFEVLSSSEWYFPVSFTPNTFVDISKELASKIKAIKAYKNELREFPHPRSVIAIEANARKWGSVSGFSFAEAFSLVRSLDS